MRRYLLLTFIAAVTARNPLYGTCSVADNHLDANTKEFITDCDSFGCWYYSHAFITSLMSFRLLGERYMPTASLPVCPFLHIVSLGNDSMAGETSLSSLHSYPIPHQLPRAAMSRVFVRTMLRAVYPWSLLVANAS